MARVRSEEQRVTSFVISTRSLPGVAALTDAAQRSGWRTSFLDEHALPDVEGKIVYYGGSDVAMRAAARFTLALLEPPLDLLARLPAQFLQRPVEFATVNDLHRLNRRAFVKPADALNKSFDAGIYSDQEQIRASCAERDPILISEPVEWSAEYRCFIHDGKIVAWSPYLSFGRPIWKPYLPSAAATRVPENLQAFCARLFAESRLKFPPAFVMDIGLIDDRGWAVVEFNPIWCSGLLGANPSLMLPALERACQSRKTLSVADRHWVVSRKQPVTS